MHLRQCSDDHEKRRAITDPPTSLDDLDMGSIANTHGSDHAHNVDDLPRARLSRCAATKLENGNSLEQQA